MDPVLGDTGGFSRPETCAASPSSAAAINSRINVIRKASTAIMQPPKPPRHLLPAVLSCFGEGGPRYAANPGLTPSFRRSLPETGCLSQGFPCGIFCPFVVPPNGQAPRATAATAGAMIEP